MRSRNSREAPEVNRSGGSHGRSRWQSAEILRYCMACPPGLRPRNCTLFIRAGDPPRPHAVPASYAQGARRRLAETAPICDYGLVMPDEVNSGGEFPKDASLEARVAAVEARLDRLETAIEEFRKEL